MPHARVPSSRRTAPRGFTLLETMLALLIVGIGVLAFVEAQASFTRSNSWSSHAATGMLLAQEVRELTRHMPSHDPVTGLSVVASGGSTSAVGWGRESDEVTALQLDDVDDLDGMTFGLGGTFPGPIDAFRTLVPQLGPDGEFVLDEEGDPIPLRGWRQRVIVEKVDPYNFGTVRAAGYAQAATSQWPAVAVDRFPLRVTVFAEYQRPGSTEIEQIATLSWIIPAP